MSIFAAINRKVTPRLSGQSLKVSRILNQAEFFLHSSLYHQPPTQELSSILLLPRASLAFRPAEIWSWPRRVPRHTP